MKKANKNGHRSTGGEKTFTSLADLTSDPRNARKHTPRNVGTIVDALHEVGAARSIVIDEDGVILAGNASVDAAIEAGLTKVQVVDGDGETVIAVRRSGLTAKQKTRLALFDNRAAELAEWDADVLAQLVDTKELEGMFSDKELAEILSQTGVEPTDAEPQIDKAEELRQKWGTETGQLWVIGNHRLLVGDATNKADVGRLLSGKKVDIILTDPPYSSGGFQDGLKRGSSSVGTRSGETIARDNLTSRGFLALIGRVLGEVDADVCYMFTDWRMWSWVFDVLESSGYPVRNMLVWDKGQMGMGFPWRCQHELIAFAKRTPAKMLDGKRGNVLQAKRTGNDNHPTEKPVSLIEDILSNTDGQIIYEPFTGSGTTLIGAENSGRQCYAMEINTGYSAVTLERMSTAFPHLKIEKVDKAEAA